MYAVVNENPEYGLANPDAGVLVARYDMRQAVFPDREEAEKACEEIREKHQNQDIQVWELSKLD